MVWDEKRGDGGGESIKWVRDPNSKISFRTSLKEEYIRESRKGCWRDQSIKMKLWGHGRREESRDGYFGD